MIERRSNAIMLIKGGEIVTAETRYAADIFVEG